MRHIKAYIPVHMEEEKSDNVVIIGGGNDLSGKGSVQKIANEIIDAGVMCKMKGATSVMLGSVLPRRDFDYQLRRHELNKLLRDLCVANSFTYVDNSNIVLDEHVAYDDVHLNHSGTKLLHDNLLYYLNA